MDVTKSMPAVTPSTKAKKVVVRNDMSNASMNAIKRGLNDMELSGCRQSAIGCQR